MAQSYTWTKAERERAKALAEIAAGQVFNGPTAGDLRQAAWGSNEDLLYAIHIARTAGAPVTITSGRMR